MSNGFVHIELNTENVKKARSFYKSLFDWKLGDMKMGPGMTYTTIDAGKGKTGGGMQNKPMPDAPTAWLPYVEVDDVKRSIAKARKLGAQVMVDYQPIPNMGAFGIFVDPTGAALGIWERSKQAAAKRTVKKGAKKGVKKAAKRTANRR